MEVKEYIQILWKWLWLIVLCTLIAGGTSFMVSNMMAPVYEAKVVLMANQATPGIMDYSSLLGGQRMIETYQELLKTRSILETVISSLGLPYSPRELSKQIEVNIIPDTQLLELTVEDNDPQRAADIANEIALTFLFQRSTNQQLQEIESYEQKLIEQMQALEQVIETTKAQAEQMGAVSSLLTQEEFVTLQNSQSQQQTAYANLLSSYLNIRVMKSRLLDVVVAEPAWPSTISVRPRKLLYTGLAAVSGCMIACVMAFLLDYLNDTVENADELQEALSLPSLGAIPFVKSWHNNGHVHIQDKDWAVAEAFRVLRTNIQFANVDRMIRTLLITSPGPSEGKTSVAANLAKVIAGTGRRVLLVDADLRRPSLHQALETANYNGLTTLILNGGTPEKFVSETDTENLYLLSSGPTPPNPSELLGSKRMTDLVKEFQNFADVVLFDAPPVLACADAMVLASRVDGVLLLLDSRTTRRDIANQALEMLRNVDAKVLGGVLNKVNTRSSGYYYYYQSDGKKKKRSFWARLRFRSEQAKNH